MLQDDELARFYISVRRRNSTNKNERTFYDGASRQGWGGGHQDLDRELMRRSSRIAWRRENKVLVLSARGAWARDPVR
jgi:hypothetical protein